MAPRPNSVYLISGAVTVESHQQRHRSHGGEYSELGVSDQEIELILRQLK